MIFHSFLLGYQRVCFMLSNGFINQRTARNPATQMLFLWSIFPFMAHKLEVYDGIRTGMNHEGLPTGCRDPMWLFKTTMISKSTMFFSPVPVHQNVSPAPTTCCLSLHFLLVCVWKSFTGKNSHRKGLWISYLKINLSFWNGDFDFNKNDSP